MRFREHRGSLDDSMKTVVEVKDRAELVSHLHTLLDPWLFQFHEDDLQVTPYVEDDRIGWNTYIVTLKGYGVVGFTDGPL